MTRIAIIGGGLSGLTAAHELEKACQAGAPLDWHLYEASDRLGGILHTTRIACPEAGTNAEYILEGGPDGWVTEKPWARELALELGLGGDLIYSNDATRKTYIYLDGQLQAIPAGMRLMVPENLDTLDNSPLFSPSAKQAYANELARAALLRSTSPLLDPAQDESAASFVLRHFGPEVLDKLAAPLLSGVFGGDVHKLSVRAVMPQFVRMEREHGSLILALQQAKRERGERQQQPLFTSLRRGMGSLIDALVATLPPERLRMRSGVSQLWFDEDEWNLDFFAARELSLKRCFGADSAGPVEHLILATPPDRTRRLLEGLDPVSTTLMPSSGAALSLLPKQASSAVLVALTWPGEPASTFNVPPGFGFLVPEHSPHSGAPSSTAVFSPAKVGLAPQGPPLLACTFVDQKFPHRAPSGARILRAFFGSEAAQHFASATDATIAEHALQQLSAILGPLPRPEHTTVSRWPRSLPQYEVGHMDRMAQLDSLVATIPGLTLLGNSYRGVGLPDLIRDARSAAVRIVTQTRN